MKEKIEKTHINKAIKLFSISRTTLYSYLKKLHITPIKHKNRSYLTNTQVQLISEFIHKDEQSEQHRPNTDEQPNTKNTQHAELEILKNQLEQAQQTIKDEREKNEQLFLQLGCYPTKVPNAT